MIYYTYAYLRKDKTPYYIGKGSNGRIYEKNGRVVNPPKDKSRIIYLKQNLTEEAAFRHEVYMIVVYGRIDLGTGILYNRTNGGEGTSNPSQETRDKISAAHKGKQKSPEAISKNKESHTGKKAAQETRDKMSASQKGRVISQEHRKKLSVALKGKQKSPEAIAKNREAHVGRKCWNNGVINKMSKECPGPDWIGGRVLRRKT